MGKALPPATSESAELSLEQLMALQVSNAGALNPRLSKLLSDCRSVYDGLVRIRCRRQVDTVPLADDLEVCVSLSCSSTSWRSSVFIQQNGDYSLVASNDWT